MIYDLLADFYDRVGNAFKHLLIIAGICGSEFLDDLPDGHSGADCGYPVVPYVPESGLGGRLWIKLNFVNRSG
jgi:hypothetical protein